MTYMVLYTYTSVDGLALLLPFPVPFISFGKVIVTPSVAHSQFSWRSLVIGSLFSCDLSFSKLITTTSFSFRSTDLCWTVGETWAVGGFLGFREFVDVLFWSSLELCSMLITVWLSSFTLLCALVNELVRLKFSSVAASHFCSPSGWNPRFSLPVSRSLCFLYFCRVIPAIWSDNRRVQSVYVIIEWSSPLLKSSPSPQIPLSLYSGRYRFMLRPPVTDWSATGSPVLFLRSCWQLNGLPPTYPGLPADPCIFTSLSPRLRSTRTTYPSVTSRLLSLKGGSGIQ